MKRVVDSLYLSEFMINRKPTTVVMVIIKFKVFSDPLFNICYTKCINEIWHHQLRKCGISNAMDGSEDDAFYKDTEESNESDDDANDVADEYAETT